MKRGENETFEITIYSIREIRFTTFFHVTLTANSPYEEVNLPTKHSLVEGDEMKRDKKNDQNATK